MLQVAACLLWAAILPGAAFADDEVVLAQASADAPPAEASPADHPAIDAPWGAEPALPRGDKVTMEDALRRALSASPRLKEAAAAEAASRGGRLQAGMRVNPEFGVETQNIAGRGQYRGIDSAETLVGVSQLIELGGKREARIGVAEQGVALAGFDAQAARLDLIRDVELAFADAAAAQERVALAGEQQKLAQQVLETVRRRVGAAREPLIQQKKAEVALSSARIALEQARRNHLAAKNTLALLWGGRGDFAVDSGQFYAITEPAPLTSPPSAMRRNPNVARYGAEIARSRAALELERANAVPDPRVGGGVRDFRNGRVQAFVVNMTIPIPVLNRNQGNIERARQDLTRSEEARRSAELAAGAELTRSQADMEAAYWQAVSLKEANLPAASEAFSLSRQGYEAGRFPYLEVLDAQRTLHELRSQYVEALRTYHRGRAEVARLTASRPSDEPAGVPHDE